MDARRAAGQVGRPCFKKETTVAQTSQITDRERTAVMSVVGLSMHPDNRSRTYFVVVSRRGNGANPFGWEIQRRKEAMGVKISGDGYRSHRAAQEAGSSALDKFLNELSKEAELDR
jgi:hypothetical protein